MPDLLLTLGHNASAIVVNDDGTVHNAYEGERISGVKSDSRFPLDAIQRATEGVTIDRTFVTHWDPMNSIDQLKSKYWDRSLVPGRITAQEDMGMTHHDAHARAALAFAGEGFSHRDAGVLIIDGFGCWSEHLSYYRISNGIPVLARRVFGYETSLGLMYQYATAFLGMKMHEDEYKLLGYAAKVEEIGMSTEQLREMAFTLTSNWTKKINALPAQAGVGLEALIGVQTMWNSRLMSILEKIGVTDHTSEEARIAIGFVVQKTLEMCVTNFLHTVVTFPTNLIFAGGVAYNVALNRVLLKQTRGQFCPFPLAGDQGNSIGMWSVAHRKTPFQFGDLCWGKRNYDLAELPDGLYVAEADDPEITQFALEQLDSTGFVNIVRGRMEFGPRALCNTTTLAVAYDSAVIDEINRINGRNTVMPFAPVVLAENADTYFEGMDRLHRSGAFMICATDYVDSWGQHFSGAALKTADGAYTGRPQAYTKKGEVDTVYEALKKHDVLINTSFNVHGVPICCDLKQVVHSHQYQYERNSNVRTIVIKE